MLYIRQGGRCGNQLFSYAFARKLQMQYNNEEMTFLLGFINQKASDKNNGDNWEDSLRWFNTVPYSTISEPQNEVMQYGSLVQKLCYQLWSKVFMVARKVKLNALKDVQKFMFKTFADFGFYYYAGVGTLPYKLAKATNKFIWGAFEDSKWFDDIKPVLLEELTPKQAVPRKNLELYNKITSANSVCVSLRKWSIDVHSKANLKNRDICDADYYKKAIAAIKERVENPVFIVFSDDVEWAKAVLREAVGDAEVYSETGDDNVAEKLRLMYSCKHFIIANSTFSWWAQYLCRNENKIVVSPDKWFANQDIRHPLISDEWVLIPC